MYNPLKKCMSCSEKSNCVMFNKFMEQQWSTLELYSYVEELEEKLQKMIWGEEMYILEGVFAEKWHAEGYVLRMKSTFKQILNTKNGVEKFVEEMKPFASITITLIDKDVTSEFI